MKYIIIGILIGSLFSTICLLIYDSNNKQIFEILSGGIFIWIICGIGKVFFEIKEHLKFHNVRSLLKCPDNKMRYVN